MPNLVCWQVRLSRRHLAQKIELERAKAFRENRRPLKLSPFSPPQSHLCPDPASTRAYAAHLRTEPLPRGDARAIAIITTAIPPEPWTEPEQLQLVGCARPQPEPE